MGLWTMMTRKPINETLLAVDQMTMMLCRMRRSKRRKRRKRRIDEPMGDGIMYAPAACHIRRLVSRHHKTPNLSAGHSYFHQICIFCQEFDQLLLTCESLAAASLAWMMNPLNLDSIVVGMVKMMMKRRSRISKEQQNDHPCLQPFQYKCHTQLHNYTIAQLHKCTNTQIQNYTNTKIKTR